MNGKAEPHRTLQKIASSTAQTGVPKILSSFAARTAVLSDMMLLT